MPVAVPDAGELPRVPVAGIQYAAELQLHDIPLVPAVGLQPIVVLIAVDHGRAEVVLRSAVARTKKYSVAHLESDQL